MAISKKYYAVWKGRHRGIFDTWEHCLAQVNGFPGAQYKAFPTRALARQALDQPYGNSLATKSGQHITRLQALPSEGIVVDASCPGNPGPVEFRGVNLRDGKEIFHRGPFTNGTNNIGEFLAIVHALEYIQQKNQRLPIYSDSKIAIGWVRKKSCQTKQSASKTNAELFRLIRRAEDWLRENDYPTSILKWKTEEWGENPADFGRK
jgi:ribonuclease HI